MTGTQRYKCPLQLPTSLKDTAASLAQEDRLSNPCRRFPWFMLLAGWQSGELAVAFLEDEGDGMNGE